MVFEMDKPTTNQVGLQVGAVLTALGALALLSITIVLAWYNTQEWFRRGLPLLGGFAILTEFIALLMGPLAEIVGGKGKGKGKRRARVALCLIFLVGCEAFNSFGTHQAWGGTLAQRAETLTAPQRDAIAAAEARLRTSIAGAESAIQAAQSRVDAAAKPNCEGAGPLTCQSRTQAWEAQTAPDRADLAENRAHKAQFEQAFRDLDRTIEPPPPPVDEVLVNGFLAFLAFLKVAGLWALGVGVARIDRSGTAAAAAKNGTDVQNDGTMGENVVPFFRSKDEHMAFVRAMRAQNPKLSFGDLGRRCGVPKTTAYRWCQ